MSPGVFFLRVHEVDWSIVSVAVVPPFETAVVARNVQCVRWGSEGRKMGVRKEEG